VRLIPRCWASSPNWSQSSSSRRMWASCLDISNLGRGIGGQFTTSPHAIDVRVAAVSGTLRG
jgi:hypothetical protein